MFTVQHVASRLGITPRQARKFLRTLNHAHTPGARYEFTAAQLDVIEADYQRHEVRVPLETDPSEPGLPVEFLTDPQRREDFVRLRRARIARLNHDVQRAGLSVPQMTVALVSTGRALAVSA